jgi:hypothetical protein
MIILHAKLVKQTCVLKNLQVLSVKEPFIEKPTFVPDRQKISANLET